MRLPAVVVVMVCLLGCSSTGGKLGAQPSWRTKRTVQPGTAVETLEFAPKTAGVILYNQPFQAQPELDTLSKGVVGLVRDLAVRNGKEPPGHDPRLSEVASELAAVTPREIPPPFQMVEFSLQRWGIIEPMPTLIVNWAPSDADPGVIIAKLEEQLGAAVREGNFNRVGVGSVRRSGASSATIIALQSSYVTAGPIPKVVPSDGKIKIQGAVLEPYTDPRVFVTRPDGSVDRLAVIRVGATGFRVDVDCAGATAKLQVELTALSSFGSTVLANFPVWCGMDPPAKIAFEINGEDYLLPRSAIVGAKRMLELINRDRARHGLRALLWSDDLATVALGHSEEMQRTGNVVHVSPVTGSAADRVKRAHITTSLVLENVAQAYSVGEAEEALMSSPGHRANILSREATHVGVGLVMGNEQEIYFTQLFGRIPKNLSEVQAREAIAGALSSVRPVVQDRQLSQLAQELAGGLARGEPEDIVAKRASGRLQKMRTSLSAVTTLITALNDISAFDARSALTEPRVTHIGVGIVRGPDPTMGDRAYHVVVLLGQK